MTRGSYAPLDRDRHFVASYAADEAVDYAKDRTLGATLRPALPAISEAFLAKRSARNVWHGMRGLPGREAAGTSFEAVGGKWFHSVADRKKALQQMAGDFQALAGDLTRAIAERHDVSDAQWIDADVTPLMVQWQKFAAFEDASWWTRAATRWEAFEEWNDKLRRLRELARARGITLSSPEPAELPQTIWEKGEAGLGGPVATGLGVAKMAIFTALFVGGAVHFYGVMRRMLNKETP